MSRQTANGSFLEWSNEIFLSDFPFSISLRN